KEWKAEVTWFMELLIVPAPALDVVHSRCFVRIYYGKPHENGLNELLNYVAYKAPQSAGAD
ncbi:hypothetical protein XENORESO_021589, partial [Xenotaenia resolanae]